MWRKRKKLSTFTVYIKGDIKVILYGKEYYSIVLLFYIYYYKYNRHCTYWNSVESHNFWIFSNHFILLKEYKMTQL